MKPGQCDVATIKDGPWMDLKFQNKVSWNYRKAIGVLCGSYLVLRNQGDGDMNPWEMWRWAHWVKKKNTSGGRGYARLVTGYGGFSPLNQAP
jgi:hypothetical protein